MGNLFGCMEDRKRKLNWNKFYRRTLDDDKKFNKVTGFQQALWFMLLFFTGIIGQLMFRMYFNYWDLQVIWLYIPLFWYPIIGSIFPAIFMMMGCFWALPIYDGIVNKIPFPLSFALKPIINILFAPFLSSKYQTPLVYPYNTKTNRQKKKGKKTSKKCAKWKRKGKTKTKKYKKKCT